MLIPVISFFSSTRSIRYSPILRVLRRFISCSYALSSSTDSKRLAKIALKLRTSMKEGTCWVCSYVCLLSYWRVILTSSRLLMSSTSFGLIVSRMASNCLLWQRRLTREWIAFPSILSLSWVLLCEVRCLTHSCKLRASIPMTSTESLSSLLSV